MKERNSSGGTAQEPAYIRETQLASSEVISVNCSTNHPPERKHRGLQPRPTIALHVPVWHQSFLRTGCSLWNLFPHVQHVPPTAHHMLEVVSPFLVKEEWPQLQTCKKTLLSDIYRQKVRFYKTTGLRSVMLQDFKLLYISISNMLLESGQTPWLVCGGKQQGLWIYSKDHGQNVSTLLHEEKQPPAWLWTLDFHHILVKSARIISVEASEF